MKYFVKNAALLITSILIFTTSCTKEEEPLNPNIENQTNTASNLDYEHPVLDYILSLGFSESDVIDKGNKFIVQGDIGFSKDMVLTAEVKGQKVTDKSKKQYYIGLVDFLKQPNIRVMIDPSMSDETSAINAAIAMWNNVRTQGSNIGFSVVTSGSYDIIIKDTDLSFGFCGLGDWPSGGIPGDTIDIDLDQIASDSYAQRTATYVHELAHNIGISHTDVGTFGGLFTAVPGYGGSDSNSIMNSGECGNSPTQLSFKDRGALITLYRYPKPLNNSIQITSSQFKISWQNPDILANGSNHISNKVTYGGFSGQNFGGTVTLPASQSNYTIPNADPYPSSNNTTGGISVSVTAVYSNANYQGQNVSRNKNGGVWF